MLLAAEGLAPSAEGFGAHLRRRGPARHRRAVHRGQGARRRLLDPRRRLARRGRAVGASLPARRSGCAWRSAAIPEMGEFEGIAPAEVLDAEAALRRAEVRRAGRAVRPADDYGEDDRDALHAAAAVRRGRRDGRPAARPGDLRGDGPLQHRDGRRRGAARRGGPAPELAGCVVALRHERRGAHGQRRPLHRGQGAHRRVLDPRGRLPRGGRRVGPARPVPRRASTSQVRRVTERRGLRRTWPRRRSCEAEERLRARRPSGRSDGRRR